MVDYDGHVSLGVRVLTWHKVLRVNDKSQLKYETKLIRHVTGIGSTCKVIESNWHRCYYLKLFV